jgi:hypothetical protein
VEMVEEVEVVVVQAPESMADSYAGIAIWKS